MRFESLRSFMTLVEAGSYAVAAESLFMSATTVHGHVKALEEELGVTLVSFAGRKLDLTRAGARLVIFAERVLSEQQALQNDLAVTTRQGALQLRIASLHGPSVHLLPPVIRAFQDVRRDVRVTVYARGVGESLAALLSGEATIAVVNELHNNLATGGLGSTQLYEDDLVLVVRADDYRPPDRDLLVAYPLALQPPSSGYRQDVERWARAEGIPMHLVYEHSSFDGILSYVMSGRCVGLVGRYAVDCSPLRERLRVLDLPTLDVKRTVIALHAAQPDPLSAEFLSFFQRFYAAEREGLKTVHHPEIS